MNVTNGIPFHLVLTESEAQRLQIKYKFYFCESRNGVHLVFTSRHFADKFASEVLKLPNEDFGISVVYTENWKAMLGYQINITSVPIVYFSGQEKTGYKDEEED